MIVTRRLSKEEFKAYLAGPMTDVTAHANAAVDIWPYVEYWHTSDPSLLSNHMRRVDVQIAQLVAEKPSCQVAFRLPSGRIIDLIG